VQRGQVGDEWGRQWGRHTENLGAAVCRLGVVGAGGVVAPTGEVVANGGVGAGRRRGGVVEYMVSNGGIACSD
jgi:hypothetical protein